MLATQHAVLGSNDQSPYKKLDVILRTLVTPGLEAE